MALRLAHRGPDGHGIWTDGAAGLAHTRLAIIDLDGGRQPMVSSDSGCALTYNGEIYNYRELRRQLAQDGCSFQGASDTEVVLRAYERWGNGCVERFDGMFAFAVWDPRTQTLFAARDRLGIKPLHFKWDRRTLTLASELGALLDADPSASRTIDTRSFDAYLRLQYVPGPHTMVSGIEQLPPGSTMTLAADTGTLTSRRYWHPTARRGSTTSAAELQEKLGCAVRSHLVADVPVGALLSGGIDSSLIAAHMTRASAATVHTFSVGFDDPRLDERAAAKAVAAHLGTAHHERVVTASDALAALPAVISAMDQPLADYAALPTYLIARFAAQHVKVVLTGEGADELFGGYRRYRRDLLLQPFASLRRPYQPSHVFSDAETSALTGRRPAPLRLDRPQASRDADALNRMLARDVGGWLADDLLVKVDRMTMACSLEARVPYLDHRFVEYALGIPRRLKLHLLSGANKTIVREGASMLVPPAIAERRKQGFKPPIDDWLRGPLRSLAADALLGRDAVIRTQIESNRVARLLDGLDWGRPYGHRLWTLLVHELWSRERGVA